MHVIPIPTHQGALQIESPGSCDCFELPANRRLTSQIADHPGIPSNRRQKPRKYRIKPNPIPSRIRGITFSLNLWSRRSDNITPLKEVTLGPAKNGSLQQRSRTAATVAARESGQPQPTSS